MNWITNIVRPRIKGLMAGKGKGSGDTPENLWKKCPSCGEMVFHRDLVANLNVCPSCGHHMRIGPAERFAYTFDPGSFSELPPPANVPADPLRFKGEKKYSEEIKAARAKTGRPEAFTAARGTIDELPVMVGVQPFDFLGGSLGMGVGEALVESLQTAVKEKRPYILFVASGGARMQEGILSLMQMPRTTAAVQMLREAKQPYIVVLTNPTTGGVTASYAMLGDVQIAEPGALIGFAGARVIEQTIREKLPEGFQRAEYLREHGMVDMVVHRHELRPTLARLCRLLTKSPSFEPPSRPAPQVPAPAQMASGADAASAAPHA
jgi:acetyl-CoA carboxylase carboxyl transferase subunit beta